jgi:hypothetical protein
MPSRFVPGQVLVLVGLPACGCLDRTPLFRLPRLSGITPLATLRRNLVMNRIGTAK